MVKRLLSLLAALLLALPLCAAAEYTFTLDSDDMWIFGDYFPQESEPTARPDYSNYSAYTATPTPQPADPSVQVIDDAGVLTPDMYDRITQEVNALEKAHHIDVIVLITYNTPFDSSYNLYRVERFADDYFDYGGYGMGKDFSGVLYLIDLNNRVQYISTGGVMMEYIDDEREEELLDLCEPYLLRSDWGGAALKAVQVVSRFMEEGRQRGVFLYDRDTGERLSGIYNPLEMHEILLGLGAGVLAGVLVIAGVSGSYNLKGKTYTYDLAAKSGMNMTADEEVFIRQSVTRHARSSSSSGGGRSGGFSGGRSGGSGVHRSSSGRSHGGGGRRF